MADLPELKKLVAKFGKIGSNLNQIARHFNGGGIYSQETRKAIDQNVARIYEMKYEVLKMAGDFHSAAEWHECPKGYQGMPGGRFYGNTAVHV